MRISDWSSDVCPSDLGQGAVEHHVHRVVEIGALGVLAQRDLLETVEGGADFGVGHAGEAWIGSDRTILPGVGSHPRPPVCRRSAFPSARMSRVRFAYPGYVVRDRKSTRLNSSH